MHTTTAQHTTDTTADALPACPAEITLADGITKARIFSWTEGGEDSPIVGVYMLDGHGLVPAAWRADGTLYEEGRSHGNADDSGLRIAELSPNVVAFHSARIVDRERRSDPMQSLVRQLKAAFDEHSAAGSGAHHLGIQSRIIELESEDGNSESVVIVPGSETPESLAAQYGHRIISAGYLYRSHMSAFLRDRMAREAGAKVLPSASERRRARATKAKPKNRAA